MLTMRLLQDLWRQNMLLFASAVTLSLLMAPTSRLLAQRVFDSPAARSEFVLQIELRHETAVTSVAFSPDGKTLASGSEDKTIRIWDARTGEMKRMLIAPKDSGLAMSPSSSPRTKKLLIGNKYGATSVAFSPDSKTLASVSWDKMVRLWDLQTGKLKRALTGHRYVMLSAAFSPDGKILASGSVMDEETSIVAGPVMLWDMETGDLKRTLPKEINFLGPISVAFSPDWKTLAGGGMGEVRLWDAETGEERRRLQQLSRFHIPPFPPDPDRWEPVFAESLDFSPDGKILASGNRRTLQGPGEVKLWEVQTGKLQQTLEGHSHGVTSVAFSPDGEILASGSEDSTVRLWDVRTGQERKVLTGHVQAIRSVAFSPDGKTLASGSDDKTVRLWRIKGSGEGLYELKATRTAESPARSRIALSELENPELIGKRNINKLQIGFYSLDKEVTIGRQFAQEVDRAAKLVEDPIIVEYINKVGQNLVLHSDAKVPFTIKVIDSDEVNAFALPGGFMYVNKGVILEADNEAELAGPMAHIIAHIAARHGVEQASKGQIVNWGWLPSIFLGGWGGFGARQAASLFIPRGFLEFSREVEYDADMLGAQYMWATGYDPHALPRFFEKLQAKDKKKPSTSARIFSAHPIVGDHIVKVNALITRFPKRGEYTLNTTEFNQVKARLSDRAQGQNLESKRPTLRHVLLGRWEGTVQSPQGERQVIVTFKRIEGFYTGTISGMQGGTEVTLKEVKLENEADSHKVTAYTQIASPQGDLIVKYDLLFQNWTWKGKAEMNIGGQILSFPVDLRRVDESVQGQKSASEPPMPQQPRNTGAQPVAPATSKSTVKALTNLDIIDLAKNGLDEANLIDTIKEASAVQFDLSPEAQRDLLRNGISNKVIAAMRARQAAT